MSSCTQHVYIWLRGVSRGFFISLNRVEESIYTVRSLCNDCFNTASSFPSWNICVFFRFKWNLVLFTTDRNWPVWRHNIKSTLPKHMLWLGFFFGVYGRFRPGIQIQQERDDSLNYNETHYNCDCVCFATKHGVLFIDAILFIIARTCIQSNESTDLYLCEALYGECIYRRKRPVY